jgi:hypothetical protein
MVELVGGPWDGHHQELMTTADLNAPRETLGAWLVVDGCTARAVYEPDPPPAPPTVWRFRGWAGP